MPGKLRDVWILLCLAVGCDSSSSSPPPSANHAAPAPVEADELTFSSGALTLGGFIYRPPGAGPFPAIVFNHGSEENPGDKRDFARFYVDHGFVFFVPHRRGHGRSKNAGEYIGNAWDPDDPDSPRLVDALVAQTDDVMAAVEYVRSLPYVDKTRVATVGCSYGGIQALFAAERGTGLVSAIDFAGAAIMWSKTAPLRERMKTAARNAKVPVFFIQADNDFDTSPTRVLSEEMTKAGKPVRARVFPPYGTTPLQGHKFCFGGDDPAWADDVLSFLADTMKRR